MSTSYETDDQFWLTFFHEAGHILLHKKRGFFLEMNQQDREEDEQGANTFAIHWLLPRTLWQRFLKREEYRSEKGIRDFAETIGIAPGIVVGRLQREQLLPADERNELKRKLYWNDRNLST